MRSKLTLSIVMGALMLLGSGCKETLDQRFEREARTFTEKNCPKDIDRYTTLDSTTYNPVTKTYAYVFTVKNELDMDSLYTDDVVDELRSTYLKDIRNSIQMKDMKDAGLTIEHIYRSQKTGKILMHFVFTKKSYAF